MPRVRATDTHYASLRVATSGPYARPALDSFTPPRRGARSDPPAAQSMPEITLPPVAEAAEPLTPVADYTELGTDPGCQPVAPGAPLRTGNFFICPKCDRKTCLAFQDRICLGCELERRQAAGEPLPPVVYAGRRLVHCLGDEGK